jgi:hypothetical protein
VGQLDQFAKDTFAAETASVTRGAIAWQPPPELGMSEVRLDGLLRVVDPRPLAALPAPWSAAEEADELVLEIKMPGDHLDLAAIERALLRRQVRQVQRCEDRDAPWSGQEPLWLVAPHVPAVLSKARTPELVSPGCYRVGPASFPFLWIAANDLPLEDELVPFLIARSGRALDAFVLWIAGRRPFDWVWNMLKLLPMSSTTYENLYRILEMESDTPLIEARRRETVRRELARMSDLRNELIEEGIEKGRLEEARAMLRRFLAARRLVLGADDEARIEACTELDVIERWGEQAAFATTTAEALR